MDKKLHSFLLENIKSKSQIENLENSFIEDLLEKYFLTNGDIRKQLEQEYEKKQEKIIKSKKFKQVLKDLRQQIGVVYGSFLTSDFKKKEKILENSNEKELEEFLKLHKSTRERQDSYEIIYEKIFDWYNQNNKNSKQNIKIGDFCCGLNPVSSTFFQNYLKENQSFGLVCSDLNPSDMNFLNSFFKKYNIKGQAKAYDLSKGDFVKDNLFQNLDLAIFFKALDSLETLNRNISKQILEQIDSKNIIVSFPTKSLVSKVDFDIKKRAWFIKFLEEKSWNYETFQIDNEIFFLIRKND